MKVTIKQIPELIREKVLAIDPDAKVILFGSRARGDFNSDSDWDFLILLSKPANTELVDQIRNRVYEIELETDEIITTVVEEEDEWENYRETLIYRTIKQDGITVN